MLGGAVKAIHDKIQAPIAICAQSVLSVASLAVQAHADVMLPIGQSKPVSNYFMSIAASGERKTASDNEAMTPVKEYEKALLAQYCTDQVTWKNAFDAHEKQRQNILKDNKLKTAESRAAALDKIGRPPSAPLMPMLTCPEPTFEGLCRLLLNGHPSLGIFSNEGGQFIGGHGMNEENKLKTGAAISGAWDGEPIKRVRAVDGATIMPGKRVSMHLMVQPGVAHRMLSDPTLADQGLLSRMLISAPESNVGNRFSREVSAESIRALDVYNARIKVILETPYPLAKDKENELEPRIAKLNEKATKAYWGFCNHTEKLMATGGAMETIRPFANKLPEHAVRLACVLALTENLHIQAINEHHLAAGIQLAQYYASEALRIFDASQIAPELELAIRLLYHLQHNWELDVISLPDIYQRCLNAIRDNRAASKIVAILEAHGWMVKIEGGAIIKDVRRKEAWKIIKEPFHENIS